MRTTGGPRCSGWPLDIYMADLTRRITRKNTRLGHSYPHRLVDTTLNVLTHLDSPFCNLLRTDFMNWPRWRCYVGTFCSFDFRLILATRKRCCPSLIRPEK